MRGWRSRRDAEAAGQRRFNRRLVDFETRDFIDEFLEETRDVFRRANGELDLAGLTEDVFSSHPTTDVRWLKERGVDGETFYRRELAPSWDGLDQHERARKIEQFIALSHLLGDAEPEGEPPEAFLDLVAAVHTKVLLLAWAYDRTYSFMDKLFNGPLQYRTHRYRLVGGMLSRNGDRALP